MKKLMQPLAFAVVGVAGLVGTNYLTAETPPPAPPKEEAKATPISFTSEVIATKTAVTPRPMTDSIKRGLAYLIKNQQEDGGWNQGGGWRTGVSGEGGRIEGKQVEDPSDVGNTCFAVLALIRAGHTPTEGEYKANVARGLKFIMTRVEKSKGDDLYVTDVRNTQLQSKIGPYIDTFLANLVLAELKGKAGDDEKRLLACLDKTMNKIVKHQTADGQFANNGGWAPVLSVCVANKGISRARQNGVKVDDTYFARAAKQAEANVAGKPATAIPAETIARAETSAVGREPTKPSTPRATPAGSTESKSKSAPDLVATDPTRIGRSRELATAGSGDAGVRLYSIAQGASNLQDSVNAKWFDYDAAKKVIADAKAPKDKKEAAEKQVKDFEALQTANGSVQAQLGEQVRRPEFVAGFGSNGGEEFLSFLNISETLVLKGGKEWEEWDGKMRQGMEKAQDKEGSWSGQHCITGKTFCTSGALLVMLADRTPFPVDLIESTRAEKKK